MDDDEAEVELLKVILCIIVDEDDELDDLLKIQLLLKVEYIVLLYELDDTEVDVLVSLSDV